MSPDLERRFLDRWPKWFHGMTQSPRESCMAFGMDCGDGWFDLIWNLCEQIEAHLVPEDFEVAQVKEKWGGLRFYVMGGNWLTYDLISKAEEESYEVCEECGSRDGVTTEGGWLKTLCRGCRGT